MRVQIYYCLRVIQTLLCFYLPKPGQISQFTILTFGRLDPTSAAALELYSQYDMSNNTRKKSCRECSKAKRRCNLSNPCKRCIDRSLACIYTNAPSRVTPFPRGSVRQDPSAEPVHNRQIPPNAATQTWEKILSISSDTPGSITLDESNDEAAAYTAFLPDLPETQVINTETNKLCIENIMISGSDYRRADYHKVTSIWVRLCRGVICSHLSHNSPGQVHTRDPRRS